MPFNCLLWHCLQPGESVRENNVTAVFQKRGSAEAVLIFKTDHEEYKKRFATSLVSDFLFYYCDLNNEERKVALVFVELGGHKCDHSVSQLKETVKRITAELRKANLLSGTSCYAVAIYSAGSSPLNLAKLQSEFRNQYQTTLKVKQGNRVDLRNLFSI